MTTTRTFSISLSLALSDPTVDLLKLDEPEREESRDLGRAEEAIVDLLELLAFRLCGQR